MIGSALAEPSLRYFALWAWVHLLLLARGMSPQSFGRLHVHLSTCDAQHVRGVFVPCIVGERILMGSVALGCALLGCGTVHLAAKMPTRRLGRTSDTWR